MNPTVVQIGQRHWKPNTEQLRAIREYCVLIHSVPSTKVTLEVGTRFNMAGLNDITCENILRVTEKDIWNKGEYWSDTDLHDRISWSDFKVDGVPLDKRGRALLDFYIYERGFGGDHRDLMGNAHVYVDTVEGKPKIVGMIGTGLELTQVSI